MNSDRMQAIARVTLDPDVRAKMRRISALPETADRLLAILEADRRERLGQRSDDSANVHERAS